MGTGWTKRPEERRFSKWQRNPDTELETMEDDRRPRNGCSRMHVDPKQGIGGDPDDRMRETTKNEQEMHTSVVRFLNMLHRSIERVDKVRDKKK